MPPPGNTLTNPKPLNVGANHRYVAMGRAGQDNSDIGHGRNRGIPRRRPRHNDGRGVHARLHIQL